MKIIEYFKNFIGINNSKNKESFLKDNDCSFEYVEEVIDFMKKELKRRQEEKRPYELQWILNLNFLMNNQFCDINLDIGEVMQINKDYEWEIREPHNQLSPIFETRLAKLSKIKPSPFVIPANSTNKSKSTAEMSKQILIGIDKEQEMSKKRALATAWAEICGCCFILDRWEPNSGRVVFSYDGVDYREGELVKDIVTPFEIFPDSPFSQGIEGCNSIMRAKQMHVDDIYNRWGVKVDGREIDVFTLDQTNVGIGGFNRSSTIQKYSPTQVDDSEIVCEYMELPNRKHPKGLHIITAGDRLLHYGEYIYKVGNNGEYGFPLVMQVCIESPGRFWPISIIERLIPVQRNYNAVKNKKQEILNRKAIGNWAFEDDGNLDIEDIEQQGMYPGKAHLYPRGGKPPQQIVDRSSTTDFDAEEKSLLNEFVTISGVSTFASQSATPTGNTSGMALEKIKESDDTRMGLTAENINMAAIESYKIDIRMYRQFVKTPRMLRHVDKNNEIQLIEWLASDLTSDDIIIEKEDELAQTPAQRRQMVLDLLQYKLFSADTDPKIRNKVMTQLELGDWENIDDIEESHINKARRENMMAKQGNVLEPKEFDEHVLHIQEHNKWRLDVEYEELERQNPQLTALFDAHVKQHEIFIQQKMQQSMIMQMQSQLQEAR